MALRILRQAIVLAIVRLPGTTGATTGQDACDTSQWSDVKLGCGACKALVTNMANNDKYGGMCSTYCAQQGLQCVAQHEERHDDCVVVSTGSCTSPGAEAGRSTSDLICECTSMAPNPLPTPTEMATLTVWPGSNSCSGTGLDYSTIDVTQPVTNGCVNHQALTPTEDYKVGDTFSIKYECAAGGVTKETYYLGAGCVGTPFSSVSRSESETGVSKFLEGSYGGQCADLQGSTGAVSARLSKPLVNLKNIPACDMASSPSPPSSNSPSPSTSPGIACDTSQWSDVKLACGACKALVTNMHNDAKYGGMCSTYCAQQGLQCVAQYEEEHDNCVVASTGSCTIPGDARRSTSDLICECTSMAPNPLPTPTEGHTAMSSDLSSAPSAPMVTIGLAAYIFVLG